MDTDCFLERMRRYFLDAFLAFSPCQGSVPLRKYIYMQARKGGREEYKKRKEMGGKEGGRKGGIQEAKGEGRKGGRKGGI